MIFELYSNIVFKREMPYKCYMCQVYLFEEAKMITFIWMLGENDELRK